MADPVTVRCAAVGLSVSASTSGRGLTATLSPCISVITAIILAYCGPSAAGIWGYLVRRTARKAAFLCGAFRYGAGGGRKVSAGGSTGVRPATRSAFALVYGSSSLDSPSFSAGCLTANLMAATSRLIRAVQVTVRGG